MLDGYKVIITKSTVPVGTGDEVERIISERRPDAEFAVASNPEFLREGAAIADFKHPDRIVIGSDDARARAVIADLYRPLFLNQAADHVHRPAHRRAHQVRGQRLPGDQDHLHQRDRRSVRADRRQRAGGCARHGPRQPDRHQVPQRRARLRRVVLSQGRSGAAEDRPGLRNPQPYRRDRGFGQRAAQARDGAQGHRRVRRQHPRPHHRGARPHLQAQHRRHARRALDYPHHGAARRGRQGARIRPRGHEAGAVGDRVRRVR